MSYDQAYTNYQLNRSALRKFVRSIYLARAARESRGPTIDFGCGIGELLCRLPAGSLGIEVNPASVAHCQAQGLDVRLYDPQADAYRFGFLDSSSIQFRSLIVSHVLEHLDNPLQSLAAILSACRDRGIDRVIVIVPGRRGFAKDPTHRVFVTPAMLLSGIDHDGAGFVVARSGFFPFPWESAGDFFVYNEFHIVYDRRSIVGARTSP
jgi:SAM-dependent methyltransferase